MNGEINTVYKTKMNHFESFKAINDLKQFFASRISSKLNLCLVCSPLFVSQDTGLNDDLNGVEKAVEFKGKCGKTMSVVQSLAKWKRYTLGKFEFKPNTGLYTNMNAIRKDEDLSSIHSYYVDQWDWEMVINKSERTYSKLVQVVEILYSCFVELDDYMVKTYPILKKKLPPKITFITSQELYDMYPGKSATEREYLITKKHGAVFLTQIGKILDSGEKHDLRAPDYDDWNLNGDILVFNEVLNRGFELSSMGIRVDKESMLEQLRTSKTEDRLKFLYHRLIANDELPFTVGGGIGQSRVAMFFLEKRHICEVQASVWPESTIEECEKNGITLL